mgnify:CR=1 FL=1
MNIFSYISYLLFTKKKHSIDNIDDENQFVPYMINRWCSMYSTSIAKLINNTTNWLHPIFETKNEWYKFYYNILPKCQFRRIFYIKKQKKESENHDDIVTKMASNLQLSKREINLYIRSLNIDLSKYEPNTKS